MQTSRFNKQLLFHDNNGVDPTPAAAAADESDSDDYNWQEDAEDEALAAGTAHVPQVSLAVPPEDEAEIASPTTTAGLPSRQSGRTGAGLKSQVGMHARTRMQAKLGAGKPVGVTQAARKQRAIKGGMQAKG